MLVSRLKKMFDVALAAGAVYGPLCAGAVHAQTSHQTVSLAAGGSTIIQLAENPSTGYSWRLSEAESSNLAAVVISAAGFRSGGGDGAPRVGAPGVAEFRIEGRNSGAARAVFVYARPWEHGLPAGRHIVTVNVR
jgi:inhibitor of cysteine peptidase